MVNIGVLMSVTVSMLDQTVSATTCMQRTQSEAMIAKRTAAKCTAPTANVSGCACLATHKEAVVACPTTRDWLHDSKMCIKVTPDKDLAWGKHDWYYPEAYGKTCGSTSEPGSFHCTQVKDPKNASLFLKHEFNKTSPGYNKNMNTEPWCTKKWCLVDPCKCDKLDMTKSTWKDGYYSYSMCGDVDVYTASAKCTTMTTKIACDKEITCKWGTVNTTTKTAAGSSKASMASISTPIGFILLTMRSWA